MGSQLEADPSAQRLSASQDTARLDDLAQLAPDAPFSELVAAGQEHYSDVQVSLTKCCHSSGAANSVALMHSMPLGVSHSRHASGAGSAAAAAQPAPCSAAWAGSKAGSLGRVGIKPQGASVRTS